MPVARKLEDSKDVSKLVGFSVSLTTQRGGARATGSRMDLLSQRSSPPLGPTAQ